MEGRLGVIILITGYNTQAAFAASQTILIQINPGPNPRVSPAEIDVAKDHPSQVSEVGNAGMGYRDR